MNHKFILPAIVAILFWGTGCATGPSTVSLGSLLAQQWIPAGSQALAETQAPATGPAPGDTVVERVVQEVPVERVVKETVIREVPVERVIREEVVVDSYPDQVYVLGEWYPRADIVVTHVHGPGCGHYFHHGHWYNDPDLIIIGAYTPSCRYVYYGGLWYPYTDIFIPWRYHHYSFAFGYVGGFPWTWYYYHHHHHHHDHHDYHDDHHGGPPQPPDNHGGGGGPVDGRRPKLDFAAGERTVGPDRMDRRERPLLVSNETPGEPVTRTPQSSLMPDRQTNLLQNSHPESSVALNSTPRTKTLASPGEETRALKDVRTTSATKDSRAVTGAAVQGRETKPVRAGNVDTGKVRSSVTAYDRFLDQAKTNRAESAPTTVRTPARTTSLQAPATDGTAQTTRSTSPVKPDRTGVSQTSARGSGVVEVNRSPRESRSTTTYVGPRTSTQTESTVRTGRPTLDTRTDLRTTTVSPRTETRGTVVTPSRSSTTVQRPESARTTVLPRTGTVTPQTRTTVVPPSGSFQERTDVGIPSSSLSRTITVPRTTSESRTVRTITSPPSIPSRSSSPSTYRAISPSSSFRSEPSRSAAPSFSPSRSYSAPSLSPSRSYSAPSVQSGRSSSFSAPSRSMSAPSFGGHSAPSARSGR